MGFEQEYAEQAVYFVDVTSPNSLELCFHWMEENPRGSSQTNKQALAAAKKKSHVDEKKYLEKIKLVMKDIVVAESSYSSNMGIIVKMFAIPLKAMGKSGLIDKTMVSKIIGNIEDITSFHTLLYNELSKCKEPVDIGRVFLNYADFLKMYTLYVNGFDRCCDTVDELRKNKEFVKFLNTARKDKACQGRDMMSFLIMPVQRLPLYELLLKRLIKAVKGPKDTSSPLGQDVDTTVDVLSNALEKVVLIATQVNEGKRRAEERSRLLDLQSRLSGDDTFHVITPTRRLLREGELMKLSLFNMRKARLLFMFNDILLWTTTSYKIRGYVDLPRCQVELIEKSTDGLYAFEILHPKHNTLSLYCKTQDEANSWVNSLSDAIEQSMALSVDPKQQRTRSKSVVAGTMRERKISRDHIEKVASRAVERIRRSESQQITQKKIPLNDKERKERDLDSNISDDGHGSDTSSPPPSPPPPPPEYDDGDDDGPFSPTFTSVKQIIDGVRDKVTLDTELEQTARLLRRLEYEDILSLLDLVELDAPVFIKKVLEATAIVLGAEPDINSRTGKPDYWAAAEDLLVKPQFYRLLQGFNTGKVLHLSSESILDLQDYISNPLMDAQMVSDYSPEAGILWNWIRCVYAYQRQEVLEDDETGVKPRLRRKKKPSQRLRSKTPIGSDGKKVGKSKASRRGSMMNTVKVRRRSKSGRRGSSKRGDEDEMNFSTGDKEMMERFRTMGEDETF